MKKIFALAALVVGLQVAQAHSPASTILTLEKIPNFPGAVQHTLTVNRLGRVVHTEKSDFKLVAKLTGDQIEKSERLVKKSQPPRLEREGSSVRCAKPSSHILKYTADKGLVFLREGSVCSGGFKVNARPAARKLVEVLNRLEIAAHNGENMAQVEREIDEILN